MPPPTQTDLQYIDLTDFSPGIFDDYLTPGGAQTAPDGAAQMTGTFSCVASPSGGLMPAPLKVQTLNQTLIDTPAGANQYMTGDAAMHAMAFRVFSPVGQSVTGGQALPPFPDQVWIAWSWFLITNAPTNTNMTEKGRIRTYFAYLADASGTSQYPFASTTPAAPNIYDEMTHDQALVVANPPLPVKFPFGLAAIDNSRSNNANPVLPGRHITATVHAFGNAAGAAVTVYPANATPGTDSSDAVGFSANSIGTVFSHQDRLVGLRNSFSATYGTNGFGPSSEIVEFTNVNNYSVVTTSGTVFVAEHPTGYGSWISMNANQLMLVKQRGGGVSVTGPLENPTVTYLPGIPSTYGATNIGTIGANGEYIYGTTRGVFAWTGGDTAANLSPQLDGWFWRPQNDKRFGQYGSFSFVYPFVFAPNNFIYDTRTKGWWRLNVPSATQQTYAFWDTSGNGLAVGCGASVTATQTAAVEWYDPQQGQATYQWVSQPLQKGRGRYLDVREVDIVALGSGTITITLTSLDGTVTAPVIFSVTNTTGPQLLSMAITAKVVDVVVTINATSGTTAAAPRLIRMSLGYREAETGRG